jgi:membrane protein implicated in regulation of membrane protease activity
VVGWWEGLDTVSQILYCIAVPASLFLILQTILTLIGWGDFGEGLNPSDVTGLDLSPDMDVGVSTMELGVDAAAGNGAFDGSPAGDFTALSLFTLQGIVAFFTVFGWTALALHRSGLFLILALILGLAAGFLAMYGVARLILFARKLTSSGNISMNNAIGLTGKVYIPILPGQQGKVTLVVQERFVEADAISESKSELTSGTLVRVVDIRAGLLVVEEADAS